MRDPLTMLPADTAPGDSRVSQLRDRVIGRRLSTVTYGVLPGSPWPDTFRVDDQLHEVDLRVTVAFDDGSTLALRPGIPGIGEGLELSLHEPGATSGQADWHDASDLPSWSTRTGGRVTDLRVEFAVLLADHPPRPWAVRLVLDAGTPVLVALGEDDDGPSWMPDNLVVVFDPALSHEYGPSPSSWTLLPDDPDDPDDTLGVGGDQPPTA